MIAADFSASAALTHALGFARRRTELTGAHIPAVGLAVAGVIHADVGLAHLSTAPGFAFASLTCAVAQLALSLLLGTMRSSRARQVAVLLVTLVPLILLAVNVSHGLPAAVAHSHVPGEFLVAGITFRRPGPIETSGLIVAIAEVSAAIAVMRGSATSGRR